ncbi:MAG: class I SAM-dependent RNA methyltransferase [Actinomycetota bacterium]
MAQLTIDSIAHGGEGVGRIEGKAHFVAGAMPGERVEIEIVTEKRRWARGRLVDIVEASPDRVEPPCPAYPICGGCTWQHAAYEQQLQWKLEVVAGQLAHVGGLDDIEVRPTIAPGSAFGYRNRMDFSVFDGRPALHEHHSDRLVPLDGCPLLRPELTERFENLGDLSGVKKVILRTGVATRDALVLIEGKTPDHAEGWDASVVHRSRDGLRTIKGRPWFEEEVGGVRFRVPAASFFQVNTAGAEELVRLVTAAAAATDDDVLLDGYAGVGLFAATVGRSAGRVITIDTGRSAYRAVTGNLERAIPGKFRSLLGSFERLAPTLDDSWSVAIVDPPRAGLGSAGVEAVTGPNPRTIVLISCDPASLGRDAGLLRGAGYDLEWVQPVDLFPQTYHVETVSRFVLS